MPFGSGLQKRSTLHNCLSVIWINNKHRFYLLTEQMYSEQIKHKVHLGTMKTKRGGQVTGWKQLLTGNISPLQLPEERQGLERNQHQAANMPIHLLITGSTDKVNSEADCAFSMWLLTLVESQWHPEVPDLTGTHQLRLRLALKHTFLASHRSYTPFSPTIDCIRCYKPSKKVQCCASVTSMHGAHSHATQSRRWIGRDGS